MSAQPGQDERLLDEHLLDESIELRVGGGLPLRELTAAVDDVCRRAEQAAAPPCVVVHLGDGAPPPPRAWPVDADVQDVNRWERALRRLERSDSVTVAVARGACAGPALDLLLTADYRIATHDLRLLLPVNEGRLWPGMAVHRLTQQIGAARTRQLVLWGHEMTAPLAQRLALVDEVAVDSELATTIRAAVLLLGRTAGPELAISRQLIAEASGTSYEDALGAHLAACDRELRRTSALGAEPGR